MARDRLITSEHRSGDETVDVALRPQTMDEMVGQRAVLEKLEIAMTAARQRAEPIEHVLLAATVHASQCDEAADVSRATSGNLD